MKLTETRCQCAECGEYFNSLGSFDKHRKGRYNVKRYCETPESLGMEKNQAGFWRIPLTEEQKEAFKWMN